MGWTQPDEIEKSLKVICQSCHAEIGEPCRNGLQHFKTYTHTVRRKQAGVIAEREVKRLAELKAAGFTHQIQFEIVPTERSSEQGVDVHFYTLNVKDPDPGSKEFAALCAHTITECGGSLEESTFNLVML